MPKSAKPPLTARDVAKLTRKYTMAEKSLLRWIASGMWVGSVFRDHGMQMRITSIGKFYGDGKETVIDFEAEQIPEEGVVRNRRRSRQL